MQPITVETASSPANGLTYKVLISVAFCCIYTCLSVVLTGLPKHLPVLFFWLSHSWSDVSKCSSIVAAHYQRPSVLSYYYSYWFYHSPLVTLSIFFFPATWCQWLLALLWLAIPFGNPSCTTYVQASTGMGGIPFSQGVCFSCWSNHWRVLSGS